MSTLEINKYVKHCYIYTANITFKYCVKNFISNSIRLDPANTSNIILYNIPRLYVTIYKFHRKLVHIQLIRIYFKPATPVCCEATATCKYSVELHKSKS